MNLSFISTFLEVHLLLRKKQGKNIPSFSKFITETTKSQSGDKKRRKEVDETIETLNRLSLFTEDSGFDTLIF